MNPRTEQSFLLKFGDSRVDCRPWDAGLVGNELEVSGAILSHSGDDLDVLLVQEGDKAVDPLKVFLRRNLTQIWLEEKGGRSELFNVFPTSGSFLE